MVKSKIKKKKTQEKEEGKNRIVDDIEITPDFTDWEVFVDEEKLVKKESGTFIPLYELERIGNIKGWQSQNSNPAQCPNKLNGMVAVVTYTIMWKDGTISTGVSDAHAANCDGDFGKYLTSMAETRAYARALRRGLSISTCSLEEISDTPVEDMRDINPATSTQTTLIETMLEKRDMNFHIIIQELKDDPKKQKKYEDIDEISDLSEGEAATFIKWLQNAKNNKKLQKK